MSSLFRSWAVALITLLLVLASSVARADLPPPVVTPADNQLVIFYNRASDSLYDGWGLHLWNNGSCDSLAAHELEGNGWGTPALADGIDPNYGAYWLLDLKSPHSSCVNFIIHNGDEKALNGADSVADLSKGSSVFTFHGDSTLYYSPGITPSPSIGGFSAHWVERNTLLWPAAAGASEVTLYHSSRAGLKVAADGTISGGIALRLKPTNADNAILAKYPHLASAPAFEFNISTVLAKQLQRSQLLVSARRADGSLLAVTGVQNAGVLDDLYTTATFHADGQPKADEQELGVTFERRNTRFALWAPTAQAVRLQFYKHGSGRDKKDEFKPDGKALPLTFDSATGIWSLATKTKVTGKYYRYQLSLFHPASNKLQTLEVTDPYSLSLSTNSRYSQVVDLTDRGTKPAGWDRHPQPAAIAPEQQVIYEAHVRDFSANDETTDHAGKYLAFTEAGSAPVSHLRSLAEAGLTTIHLMPAFDIASVPEDKHDRVDLKDRVSKLCRLTDAPVCATANRRQTVGELLASLDPASSDAQAVMAAIRPIDSFNWGYDPLHFGVPEGSYASNPMGEKRIREFRAMVQALHGMDLQVVMDVVYNHTYAAGLDSKSVLDKVVPNYYHRLNPLTGAVENSTCCANTATENRMMAKLMIDTLVVWAKHYGIDGFRFDLMAHQPKAVMLEALAAVQAVNPDAYFYGEGWNFGEVANNARFEQASQLNMAGTGIGTFSDRLRDAARGGGCCDSGEALVQNQGFISGLYSIPNSRNSGSDSERQALLDAGDLIKLGLTGNLRDFRLVNNAGKVTTGGEMNYGGQPAGYALDPQEVVSYVSKHDNQTLWDIIQYKAAEHVSADDRARMQVLALSLPLLGQGVPFIHMGSELLRSKSMERDSYDSGDWFNRVDFSYASNNWHVGLPREDKDGANWPLIAPIIANANTQAGPAQIGMAAERVRELLAVRASSPLFALGSAEAVMARVDFANSGTSQTPGVIAMTIDDGYNAGADLDPTVDGLLVVINATGSDQYVSVGHEASFELHPAMQSSADPALYRAYGGFGAVSVPALSTVVFVVPQHDSQGAGLPVKAKFTSDEAPFGDTPVFVRGDMNGWGDANPLTFVADGIYEAVVSLPAGEIGFKIASDDWSTVDFGNASLGLNSETRLYRGFGNAFINVIEAGDYRFVFNAAEPEAPSLTIKLLTDEPPFGDTAVYVRGSMNGWGDNNALRYFGAGRYVEVMELAAGSYEFKLASVDWSTVDLGMGAVTFGDGSFSDPANGNIGLTIAEAGRYAFVLDVSTSGKQLAVVPDLPPTYGDTAIYLRGSLNGWGTDNPLSYDGYGVYTADFTASAGTLEFKIASDDWSTVDLGIGGSLTLGRAVAVVPSGGNALLTLEQDGSYRLTIITTAEGTQLLLELIEAAGGGRIVVSAPAEAAMSRLPCNRDGDPSCDLRLYQIMVESFVDGDPSRDYNAGWGNSHHKGDVRGIINSLDYIQSLGVNAIWLTPIFDSHAGEPQQRVDDSVYQIPEHSLNLDASGYFARNYFAIDPKFGSLDDVRELVNKAHERGLYVFFDGVFGHHKGGLIPSPTGQLPVDNADDDPTYPGRTVDFSHPQSVAFYQEVATYWINELGIDGWRLDQAYQVPLDAWRQIRQSVRDTSDARRAAGEQWGTLGYMVAEVWDGDGLQVATTAYGPSEDPALPSAFNFALRYVITQVLATQEEAGDSWSSGQPASKLNSEWGLGYTSAKYPDHAVPNLMLTNHDLVRFGDLLQRAGIAEPGDDEYWIRHRLAFGLMAGISGPLTLYYGDELGDEVPGFDVKIGAGCSDLGLCDDHVSRSSAKVPGVTVDPSSLDNRALELRDHVANLMALRAAHPALARGSRQHLFSNNSLFIDLKQWGSERIVVALNASDRPASVDLTSGALGTVTSARDLISGDAVTVSDGISLELAPLSLMLVVLDETPATDEPPLGADVHVRGSMNGWGMATMNYAGLGRYHVAMDLDAGRYEFKIASGDWTTVDIGFGQARNTGLGEPLVDAGNGNIAIDIPAAGRYDVLFHANPADHGVIIWRQGQLGSTVYLRGDMNGWGLTDAFAATGDGKLELVRSFVAGSYPFKLASENWMDANYGVAQNVEVGITASLPWSMPYSNNATLTIPADGDYRLLLDLSDPLNAQLLVEPNLPPVTEPVLGLDVNLRGSMNGWGKLPLVFAEGAYRSAIDLAVGSYEFKIASDDWSSVNLGYGNVELGAGVSYFDPYNGNIGLTIAEAGSYELALVPRTGKQPLLTIKAVTVTAGPVLYLRGTFNGWGLDAPLTQIGPNSYEWVGELTTSEFKLGSDNWTDLNFGGEAALTLGGTVTLAGDSLGTSNAMVELAEAGSYKLSVYAKPGVAATLLLTRP
ncbi:MAG: pullulanase-type alpha-1,6-glucosidase [Gammaproteobacteria bacterium]|nr:pullulanase-type alpha-1,6-glucosidase [Gammaproteobacteria bacterium]